MALGHVVHHRVHAEDPEDHERREVHKRDEQQHLHGVRGKEQHAGEIERHPLRHRVEDRAQLARDPRGRGGPHRKRRRAPEHERYHYRPDHQPEHAPAEEADQREEQGGADAVFHRADATIAPPSGRAPTATGTPGEKGKKGPGSISDSLHAL